jgi:hypothetical protein
MVTCGLSPDNPNNEGMLPSGKDPLGETGLLARLGGQLQSPSFHPWNSRNERNI